MNVVFLDVDGVLNTDYTETRSPMGFIGVEEKYVKNLSLLVRQHDAKVVLVSDWKDEWDPDYNECSSDAQYLVDELRKFNVEVYDKTNDKSSGLDSTSRRGLGIHRYLQAHEDVENWVVLDDVYFQDYNEEIGKHLVLTDPRRGFDDERYKEADNVMQGYLKEAEKDY